MGEVLKFSKFSNSLYISGELMKAKAVQLRNVLEADLFGCDAKWMLFVAAAYSYRYDKKLYPFPPLYDTKINSANIDTLVLVVNDTPPLRVLLHHLRNKNYREVNIEVIRLLHWVLVDLYNPHLRSLTRRAFKDLVNTLPAEIQMLEYPTYAFEVHGQNKHFSLSTIIEKVPRDNELSKDDDVDENKRVVPSIEYGFYGDRLDEFYSLLNRGFASMAQVNEPVVLMRNLDAALANSPIGAGWGASECGATMSCVALCSCIDAPPQLLERRLSRQGVELVAHSSEMVQLRYLFFYVKKNPLDAPVEELLHPISTNWLREHGYLISFGFKLIALAALGIVNTVNEDFFRQLFMRNAEFLINFCLKIFAKH